MRNLFAVLLVFVGCAAPSTPSSPPNSTQYTISDRLPEPVLATWRFDGPAEIKNDLNCQPGSILAEKLHWNATEFTVKFAVRLEGKRNQVEVLEVLPSGNALGPLIADHMKGCIERTEFTAPPRLPWEFELTLHVPPNRSAT